MEFRFFCLLASLIAYSKPLKVVDRSSENIDPISARYLLTSDFESGSLSPWFDQSPGQVQWKIESYETPFETNSPVPQPLNGSKYLRAVRNVNLQSGTAIFSSPVFTALPGDQISFSFWIRSRRLQTNALEVNSFILTFVSESIWWTFNSLFEQLVSVQGNTETSLIDLSQYSSPSNSEWRTINAISLPVTEPTDISVIKK